MRELVILSSVRWLERLSRALLTAGVGHVMLCVAMLSPGNHHVANLSSVVNRDTVGRLPATRRRAPVQAPGRLDRPPHGAHRAGGLLRRLWRAEAAGYRERGLVRRSLPVLCGYCVLHGHGGVHAVTSLQGEFVMRRPFKTICAHDTI